MEEEATMVLLVDDDPELLNALEAVLARAHVPFVSAHSLAEVEALSPRLDLVTTAILDVNLGEDVPSGVDVASWLHDHHPLARIVFMTGHAANHPLVRAAAGMDGQVVAKPISSKRLIGIAQGAA
jgi:DNA-binding NtrC family response regulator